MLSRYFLVSVIIMLVSPVIGLWYGIKNSNDNIKKWVLIIFITFYGSVINIGAGSDGLVHLTNVYVLYTDVDFFSFLRGSINILFLSSNEFGKDDLYIHFVSFLCGSVLGIPRLFFVIISFVYAYFYINSLFRIIKIRPELHYSKIFFAFLTLFVLWKGIEGINTVRTWTGLWVLFYGFLRYYESKKWKYLLLIFVTPLIHIGYYVMVLPVLIVILFGTRHVVYSVLFFLSFGFNILNPSFVTRSLSKSELGESKVQGYYVEENLSVGDKFKYTQGLGGNLYKSYSKAGIQFYMISFLASLLIVRGYYPTKMTFVENHLFSVGLLMKVLSSSSWYISALTNRSATISVIFVLAAFISMVSRGGLIGREFKKSQIDGYLLFLSLIGLLPFFLLKLSELLDFFSLFILSTPFLVWIFSDANLSIKNAIKWFFL